MSYQVLARKYRPASFSEMVGQEHVLQALTNALDQDKLHHAYLFSGTRGVGKTTVARIFARCLNCETGITATACGECSSCREIAEGRSVDLIEIDAASRRGIESMRELLDNVQYMPSRSRFKVYLIDEVHMLTKESFNAMLKTLEEPPEHVKFLFATTDPKKLPVTVLSRCLQFNLKNMSPARIVTHLGNVLGAEQIEYEEPALWLLGRAADGSMRDALSLTDQAISFGDQRVLEADVLTMLGSVDRHEVYRLLETLTRADGAELLDRVRALAEYAPDYEALLAELMSVLHRVAVAQAVPGAIDNSEGDQELLIELAEALSPEDVQLYYQVALAGRRDQPWTEDRAAGFEMTMLRMLAFQPGTAPPAAPAGDGGAASTAEKSSGSPLSALLDQLGDGKTAGTTAGTGSHGAAADEAPRLLSKDDKTPVLPAGRGTGSVADQAQAPAQDVSARSPASTLLQAIDDVNPVGSTRNGMVDGAAPVGAAPVGAAPVGAAPAITAVPANQVSSRASALLDHIGQETGRPAREDPARDKPPRSGPPLGQVGTAAGTPAAGTPAAGTPAARLIEDIDRDTPKHQIQASDDAAVSPVSVDAAADVDVDVDVDDADVAQPLSSPVSTLLDDIDRAAPKRTGLAADGAESHGAASPTRSLDPAPTPVRALLDSIDRDDLASSAPQLPSQPAEQVPATETPVVERDFKQAEAFLGAGDWVGLLPVLGLRGISYALAANCAIREVAAERVALTLATGQASMLNDNHRQRIERALCESLGRPLRLEIDLGKPAVETPAEAAVRGAAERQAEAVETILNDKVVQSLISRFNGTLDRDSIAPKGAD